MENKRNTQGNGPDHTDENEGVRRRLWDCFLMPKSQVFFQGHPSAPSQVGHGRGGGGEGPAPRGQRRQGTHAVCFWCRGVLSRCRGVVTTTFWLHTGVDVSEGLSSSSVSCLFQKFKNCQGRGQGNKTK